MQSIVLANENELTTSEVVVAKEPAIKEVTTAETDTNNSETMESESVSPLEEAESIQVIPSEITIEESKVLTNTPKVKSSEKQESSKEPSATTQQNEEQPSTKVVTSGTFPNGSTATWNFDDTTGTLTISGGTLVNPSNSIQDLTGISVSEITNIVLEDKVFASGNCSSLFSKSAAISLDLSNLDTSDVTSMRAMFSESRATNLNLSNFDTRKVTDMYCMFQGSRVPNLDLSNFDTRNVKDMGWMFNVSHTTRSIDVSSFDTSKVTNMNSMFRDTDGLISSLDLSNFDTSNVTDMRYMFKGSTASTIDMSSFNTSKVINMSDMFYSYAPTQPQNIILGSQFQFLSISVNLYNPPTSTDYTGKWQNVGSGTVDKPKGSFIGTANELMSTYDGSTMADTYVWQPVLLEVNVQDSVLMVGDIWNPEDNFLSALDNAENPVDFKDITVTGSVDTTQPGLYTVMYSYGSVTSTATVTVLETMPASWINFFVDGTNVRSIPGSALSTANWDLTTGLWDRWNPGTVKVPTDKIPSEPTKQGYEFKGWEDTNGLIVDFSTLDLDLNSQNEFNFYAAFEKKEYTVTFDVEGKQEQQAVLFEELITEPTVPNKAGYAFTGWYDAPTGGNKWGFSTDTMPSRNMTLYARFNKLGFVTPEIKPVMPNVVTPIMPGVDSVTPSVKPPTKPGEGPNVVSPSTPGFGGNQIPSNGSGSNTGNMTITSQENTVTSSPEASQQSKLANLGEQNSMILQGFGLLMVISGIAFFWWKRRKKVHS
ncbi:BspA family leucine-rich repeat surface protein [Listeria monocytogenes]|nr:BspA family leucine-rich repeat surface protein [Listeria monocytogenes]EJU4184867.1 BspA family leucine-rich repeat surface protein [Listeria monocytogenes]EKZ0248185.1 BspA family leucine-rich repeat surface protein [Listeria monocytogenes]EMB2358795.1 BspA family leucine-rich repeat surface protein [Listeria monocytogenes]